MLVLKLVFDKDDCDSNSVSLFLKPPRMPLNIGVILLSKIEYSNKIKTVMDAALKWFYNSIESVEFNTGSGLSMYPINGYYTFHLGNSSKISIPLK